MALFRNESLVNREPRQGVLTAIEESERRKYHCDLRMCCAIRTLLTLNKTKAITDPIAINRHQINNFANVSSGLGFTRFGIFVLVLVCAHS
jgi:hypothetical protein